MRRLKWLLSAVCLLLSCQNVLALSWKIRQSVDLRKDALAKILDYVNRFPQDKIGVEQGKALLADEKNVTDMHAWMEPSMKFALEALERHPVSKENEDIRQAALMVLDYPIHVNDMAADEPGVKEKWRDLMVWYQRTALEKTAKSVRETKVPAGKMAIWKVYNMGYVLKTEHHCIGWDIVRCNNMGDKVNLLNTAMADLLSQIECMFISHHHGDHLQMWCLNHLFQARKPVFTPEIPPTKNFPNKNRSDRRFTYVWENSESPGEWNGVKIQCIPGHQEKLLNSIFVVTFDGLTVMQTGDNCDKDVFAHFKEVGRVDVLIGTCWSMIPRNGQEVAAQCRGDIDRPQFYITGHENEMGHRPTNRESFQETYKRLGDRSKLMPTFILNIGEGIVYPDGVPILAK